MRRLSNPHAADGLHDLMSDGRSERSLRAPPPSTSDWQAYRFELVHGPAGLADHAAAWDELAEQALEPNVFHERWMLMPALHAYAGPAQLFIVLVYCDRGLGGPPRLCGLFPLERVRHYKGLPFPHLRLWQYKHCYLGTPLVHRNHARRCLAALLAWLAPRGGASFIEWGMVASDGPFFQALQAVAAERGLPSFLCYGWSRGVLIPRADAETFIAQTLPHKARRELRRLERRLHDLGELRYQQLGPQDDAEAALAEFLELEQRGWKGRRGSALGSNGENRRFFLRAAGEAARTGRLMLLAMRLDGRAIAMKCNLLARDGAYAFKIAYDEQYAKYSPGLLLELEHVRRFHASGLKWMDWCSEPDHFMANRLSLDRRALSTLVTASGRPAGRWLVSALPALHWCGRRLRRLNKRPSA